MSKKINFGCLSFIGIIILFVLVYFLFLSSSNSSSDSTSADGFIIRSYDVVLNVSSDNKIDVEENIEVLWYESNHHGIYRTLPQWLEYTGLDGKTISRRSTISNIDITDEYSTSYTSNNKLRIKIGSSFSYVSTGVKMYTLNYTYNMGSDPYEGFDEFIFHFYGDYWGTTINNASIKVVMPYSIEGYEINFFLDKYREENVSDYVVYTVSDNVLEATFNADEYHSDTGKKLTSSLTLDIELPEGYFEGGSGNYGFGTFIFISLIIIFMIYIIYTWFKFGKDLPKRVKTVEFYPPDGLSSAEIGYIFGKSNSNKLTISLIISLASKGFIKIDEKSDKVQITKINNESNKEMNAYEEVVYKKLFENEDVIILSEHKTFYEVFNGINAMLKHNLETLILDEVSDSKRVMTECFCVWSIIFFIISYCIIKDLNPNFSVLYAIAVICIIISIIFTLFMRRKTKYGEEIYAKILGFRDFLEMAEKDKLEALVEENPSYFYDILPYTYVLNVSKKWVSKFENIKLPEVDMGDFDYTSISSFNSLNSSVYHPHSSGSSSGGGCSSCGGGCSSCGGGGSW